nr:response regulator [Lachnospiraceae bacterium]
MTFKSILIIVQCICIVGIFIEILLILRKMKGALHLYLLLSFIALLTNECGYLLELISQNKEAYTAALKFSYFGKIWYALLMFLFVTEFTRIKIPTIVKYLMLSFHAFAYMLIFTVEYNTLYYTYFDVRRYKGFMRSEHGNGIIYRIYMTMQILYIVTGIFLLIKSHIKRKRTKEKRCILTIIAAFFVEGSFLVAQLVRIPGVSEFYDVTMVGYFIGTILMLVAMISFNLLGTVEIAKEFVIDRISEGIIAVDNEDVIEYYNKPAEKIYPGLGPDPLLKRGYGEICWDDDEILKNIKQAVAKASNIVIGDRIYTPEANDLFSGDEIIGKIYALVDDTEHYQYMSELEKQKEIADNANKAKSRFLAGMSHEIRTPINAVLGFDEMIIRESSEKAIRKYAADIMSAGKTLLSLINDILDLSKAEAGRMDIIPQQYELSSLINDLNNLTRSRAEKKGLSFFVDVNSHIPHMLIGDEVRIRQCVTNLLTNAVKYTEKGSVTLRVSFSDTEDKDPSHIMLSFEVEDTGIGMKPEDLENLFSPYKRIEEQRNRKIEGTGLGMSITRHLLELMGSDLKVNTEYGKGTTISFEIRQEVVSADEIGDFNRLISDADLKEKVYRELFHAPKGRILVVDDTEMNLTVIQSLLKKTQIRIDTADEGKKAIMLALVNEYDVLFIDHMMPDMDGIETLNAIRKEGKNTKTPAIALTANAVSGARKMYLDAGFTDYLSKPVDGEKLEKMLMNYLPDEKIQAVEGGEDSEKRSEATDSNVVLVIDDDETACSQ